MSGSIYDIGYKKLIIWLVPQVLRKPRMVAWLVALANPIIDIYDRFGDFRKLVLYKASITPQVVYLEKMLNDKYDPTERRIRIEDSNQVEALPLFTKAESKYLQLFRKGETLQPRVAYLKKETMVFVVDFIIRIPRGVPFNEPELKALVDIYKLAGKTFYAPKS